MKHDTVKFLQDTLRAYEEGTLTAGEVDGAVFGRVCAEIMAVVERGEPIMMVSSICGWGQMGRNPVKTVHAVFSTRGGEFLGVGPVLDRNTGMPVSWLGVQPKGNDEEDDGA